MLHITQREQKGWHRSDWHAYTSQLHLQRVAPFSSVNWKSVVFCLPKEAARRTENIRLEPAFLRPPAIRADSQTGIKGHEFQTAPLWPWRKNLLSGKAGKRSKWGWAGWRWSSEKVLKSRLWGKWEVKTLPGHRNADVEGCRGSTVEQGSGETSGNTAGQVCGSRAEEDGHHEGRCTEGQGDYPPHGGMLAAFPAQGRPPA